MTALAQDRKIVIDLKLRQYDLPVVANDIIYLGAACSFDPAAGNIRPATNASGEVFAGFNLWNRVDNTGGSAGDKRARIVVEGVAELPIASVAQADIGKPVYAQDDATFSLTQATNEPLVGYIEGLVYDRPGYARVHFRGCQRTVHPEGS